MSDATIQRRIVISHLQGDSDVVAIFGDLPTRFLKSFDDDDAAQAYIDSGHAATDDALLNVGRVSVAH